MWSEAVSQLLLYLKSILLLFFPNTMGFPNFNFFFRKVSGARSLPLLYITQFLKKLENITWDNFEVISLVLMKKRVSCMFPFIMQLCFFACHFNLLPNISWVFFRFLTWKALTLATQRYNIFPYGTSTKWHLQNC